MKRKANKKPLELRISYIKITYDCKGNVKDFTIKKEAPKANKCGK